MSTLAQILVRHEGLVLKPYTDSLGNRTVGVGHLIKVGENFDAGIMVFQAYALLLKDITIARDACRHYSWFARLSCKRRKALVCLMFNIGPARFATFKKMIAALEVKNYEQAAFELLDSKLAGQIGSRSIDLAEMIQNSNPTI